MAQKFCKQRPWQRAKKKVGGLREKENNHTIWSATYSASSAAWHLASLPRFLGFPCKRGGPGHLGGPHSVSREAIPWVSGAEPDRQVKSLVLSHLRVQGASLV